MTDNEHVTFRVVQPREATYHYVWDPRQLRLRVDRLTQPDRELPADYGMVQSVVWSDDLLPGLLFGHGAVAADAVVQGNVFGGLRLTPSGDVLMLVANAIDHPTSAATAMGERVWQEAESAAALLLPGQRAARLPATEAVEILRQRQREARIEGAKSARPMGRAWQAPGAPGSRPLPLSHTYSPAEYSLWRLPWRFQTYAPELVVNDERVHYFVHRPESRGRGLFKRMGLNEGLLLLTDRQVLFLQDAIPPGLTTARWGYLAKSIAVERLTAVDIRPGRSRFELHLTSTGNAGDEQSVFAFEPEARDQIEFAAQLLQPFLPGRQPWALLRLYDLSAPRGLQSIQPGHADASYLSKDVLAARRRFERETNLDEPLLADSFVPPLDRGQPTRWLAVTPRHLLLATQGAPAPLRLSFGDLTSLELQYSVLRSFLRVNAGQQHWDVDFYSTWFPAMHRVYFAARQCLAQPPAASQQTMQVGAEAAS